MSAAFVVVNAAFARANQPDDWIKGSSVRRHECCIRRHECRVRAHECSLRACECLGAMPAGISKSQFCPEALGPPKEKPA